MEHGEMGFKMSNYLKEAENGKLWCKDYLKMGGELAVQKTKKNRR